MRSRPDLAPFGTVTVTALLLTATMCAATRPAKRTFVTPSSEVPWMMTVDPTAPESGESCTTFGPSTLSLNPDLAVPPGT